MKNILVLKRKMQSYLLNPLKGLLQSGFYKLGYDIKRFRKGKEYQTIISKATYSPWNTDILFNEVYETIKRFTLVDKFRCYELWSLVEQSAKLNEGSIIEIGTWRGGTGALIAKQAKECRIPAQVYLCDTFTGVVKSGPKDSAYKGGEHSDTTRQIVEELILKQLNLDNVQILEGIFPDQTSHEIKNLQFRFCHIDVDTYQSAKDIIDWIWGKMVHGGIVVYDDYGFSGTRGIRRCVDEQRTLNDQLSIYNINGHNITIKL